jgi:AraC-like DNA-binding protein
MDRLSDRIIALADALGDGALRLRERLLNTPSLEARFRCVERWLIARLKPRTIVHPAVRWAVDQIASSGGRMPIEALATQTGFTRKHLGNLFQQQVGLSPKSLARVHRFRGALQLLDRANGQVPWAALAEQCGYYDQSHLINEFRASPVSHRWSWCAGIGPTAAASCCADGARSHFPFFQDGARRPGAESRHNDKGGPHA